jgi:hypothetical protein
LLFSTTFFSPELFNIICRKKIPKIKTAVLLLSVYLEFQ